MEGAYIVLLDAAPDRTWMKIYAEVQQVNAIKSSNIKNDHFSARIIKVAGDKLKIFSGLG